MIFRTLRNSILTKTAVLLALFGMLLASSPVAFACGPFSLDVVFSLRNHPEFPLEKFNTGSVGIVPKSYGPMSLVLFYRTLNGVPLDSKENKLAVAAMENQIFYRAGINDKNTPDSTAPYVQPTDVWTTARAKVTSEAVDISRDREVGYHYYINCLPDSFQTAAETLGSRIKEHGVTDEVREWVKGQDLVFANCSTDVTLPTELATAPDWLRFDREYQIAAALFYQNKNDLARAQLAKIADESSSPWSKTARFISARTFIREASLLTSPDGEEDDAKLEPQRRELLAKAITAFEAIEKDRSMREFHDSAARLVGLVKYRMIPDERRSELADILVRSSSNSNFYNDLTDYALILDKTSESARSAGEEIDRKAAEAGGREYDYNYDLKLRDIPTKDRGDELTDWIFTYQAADGFDHAVEKWRAAKKLPWFVAAISKAKGSSPEVPGLLAEAAKIDRRSPAFPTVRFHEIRILIEQGKRKEALAKLNDLGDLQQFPVSAQNSFLTQRTILAANLDQFLESAQRRPTLFTWSDAGREEPSEIESGTRLTPWAKRMMFDADAVTFFNEKAPLSLLKKAAVSPKLPDYLRSMIIRVVWMRAFILQNTAVEREFAPLIAEAMKTDGPLFEKYVAARTPVDREAAALIAVLRYPILEPYVESGYGREDSETTVIDSIRGNWWCLDQHSNEPPVATPSFLTSAELAQAQKEHSKIASLGEAATMLTKRALEFAEKNPTHPQTPEILHLAVRSTRYGCRDEATGDLSKQAFDLLHTKYRTSPWTKETPYWFK